jgi:hypothetical protein
LGEGWGAARVCVCDRRGSRRQGHECCPTPHRATARHPSHPLHHHPPPLSKLNSERLREESASPTPRPAGRDNWSILHRTGPHVFTDSVLRWTHARGVGFHEGLQPGGRLVGASARVVPGEAFGCAAHFFTNVTRVEEVRGAGAEGAPRRLARLQLRPASIAGSHSGCRLPLKPSPRPPKTARA